MVRKTFFFSFLLIVLVTFISFAILYFAMPGYYLHKKQQALQANLDALVVQLRESATAEDCAALIATFIATNNVTALAFDAEGAALAELSSPLVSLKSGENDNTYYAVYSIGATQVDLSQDNTAHVTSSPVTIAIRFESGTPKEEGVVLQQKSFVTHSLGGGNVITLYGEVGTAVLGRLSVSGTLQPIDEAKGVILSLMPYALALGLALGLALSWLYARQISKPILAISAAAARMQKLEPQARSAIRSRDELGLLSANLDALYASLRENISQLKHEMDKVNRLEQAKTEMMQSASHELKTPIAALSGMLEGMIDNIGVYRNKDKYLLECKGQVEKLSALVNEILSASASDGELAGEPADTAVEELIQQALADHTVAMENKGLRLISQLTPVTITTDPSALYRALTNLIGNAARHTPPGGEVRVTLSPQELAIENSCAPIAAEDLAKLFEPFYTLSYSRDKAESGAGLGLFIVRRNLERLNIAYAAHSTELGLKITLTL